MNFNLSDKQIELYAKQIEFYRQHIDIFIEEIFYPIKLNYYQHVVARSIGNCVDSQYFASRGSGKTWLAAVVVSALAVLYPGTKILLFGPTVAQGNLVLMKLKDICQSNANLTRELAPVNSKSLISISKMGGIATFKNGSSIESVAIVSARGRRGKIIVVDEIADTDMNELSNIVSPIRNFTRDACITYGFKDYESKTINLTSCFPKSNPHFKEVEDAMREMEKGNEDVFICALDYTAPVLAGLTSLDFFMKEKSRMPEATFAMEYGSMFYGNNGESAIPYDLFKPCRTLFEVETQQPKGSKARYCMAVDIATAGGKINDNTIISIMKFTEGIDEFFYSDLVFMRSYHGLPLDKLAEEIRQLVHIKFPNIEKVYFDSRGVGDQLSRFFIKPWNHAGKEYPALCCDNEVSRGGAVPLLHPIKASNADNIRYYNNLRLALEQQRITLPVEASIVRQTVAELELDKEVKDDEQKTTKKKYTFEEKAILLEADALCLEFGNVKEIRTASGSITYDTTNLRAHKDRYSSLVMALDYVLSEEKKTLDKHRIHDYSSIALLDDDCQSCWGERFL